MYFQNNVLKKLIFIICLYNIHANVKEFIKIIPPVRVNVAYSYSATVNPAVLCAVTRRLYHVAGSKCMIKNLPVVLTLFET